MLSLYDMITIVDGLYQVWILLARLGIEALFFDLVLASAQFIIKWYAFRDTLINIYGYDNFYIFNALISSSVNDISN